MTVSISSSVISQLKVLSSLEHSEQSGLLISIPSTSNDAKLSIMMAIRRSKSDESIASIRSFIPPGLEVVGAFSVAKSDDLNVKQTHESTVKAYSKGLSEAEKKVIVVAKASEIQFFQFSQFEELSNVIIEEYTNYNVQRSMLQLTLSFVSEIMLIPAAATGNALIQYIQSQIPSILEKSIPSASKAQFIFTTANANNPQSYLISLSDDKSVLLKNVILKSNDTSLHFNVKTVKSITSSITSINSSNLPIAPVLILDKDGQAGNFLQFLIPIQFVLLLPLDATLQQCINSLLSSLEMKLKMAFDLLIESTKKSNGLVNIVPYHFQSSYFPFLIGVNYWFPISVDDSVESSITADDRLMPLRKIIHERYLLPTDRPLLRLANAVDPTASSQIQLNDRLINVHKGLPPSGVQHGKLYLVHGNYSYYHYMQDKFDDNGWGCAYRSLQTICSWFRHQGYTNRKDISHLEIQKCLVEVGDKDKSFLGSRQWIGSFEVSICLSHYYHVESKILAVNQGSELASKARELAHHFETNGTPVMIGGGVLAHTILGIDFNDQTGQVKFLILDPHYTGADDLATIQKHSWCGWRDPDFFNQGAHYNMCLPQRPNLL